MKKYISIILCLIIVASVFVACSGKDNTKTDETTNAKATTETTTVITTDGAKIKDADAINLMKSYSAKELGIDEETLEKCTFMVASNGEHLDEQNKDYVKVVAVIKNEHKKEGTDEVTYSFDYKGEYYISFDGKQILSKDVETEKITEMQVKEVPTTEPIADVHEETTKK